MASYLGKKKDAIMGNPFGAKTDFACRDMNKKYPLPLILTIYIADTIHRAIRKLKLPCLLSGRPVNCFSWALGNNDDSASGGTISHFFYRVYSGLSFLDF